MCQVETPDTTEVRNNQYGKPIYREGNWNHQLVKSNNRKRKVNNVKGEVNYRDGNMNNQSVKLIYK